jgi:hypothetical protein
MTATILQEVVQSTEAHPVRPSYIPVTVSSAPRTAYVPFGIFVLGKTFGRLLGSFCVAVSRVKNVSIEPTSGTRVWNLMETVKNMKDLRHDWNGYGSEPPNLRAREMAQEILLSSASVIVPNRVAPSAQGGVGIFFYHENRYGDIECLNTGETLATISDGSGRPLVWEITPSERKGALERIGHFITS